MKDVEELETLFQALAMQRMRGDRFDGDWVEFGYSLLTISSASLMPLSTNAMERVSEKKRYQKTEETYVAQAFNGGKHNNHVLFKHLIVVKNESWEEGDRIFSNPKGMLLRSPFIH